MPYEWAVVPSPLGYLGIIEDASHVIATVFDEPTEVAAICALQSRWKTYSQKNSEPRIQQRGIQQRGIQQRKIQRQGSQRQENWQCPEHQSTCQQFVSKLLQFAAGQPVSFRDIPLELSDKTSFQRRVLIACRAIPWGETRTYGELAKEVGSPRAARAVGSVMANNRTPLIVPCHRVVGAHGKMRGFSSSHGISMKERLLKLEKDSLLI